MTAALDAAVALRAQLEERAAAAQAAVVDANQSFAKLQQAIATAARVIALLEQGQPDPVPVDPPTPPPIPDDANTVRIGAATYPLAGVNPTRVDFPGGRGRDELVAYQRPVTHTVTNVFGAECTVMAGQVIAAVDRQATGQTTGVIGRRIHICFLGLKAQFVIQRHQLVRQHADVDLPFGNFFAGNRFAKTINIFIFTITPAVKGVCDPSYFFFTEFNLSARDGSSKFTGINE